jgi:cell division protein FtsQ
MPQETKNADDDDSPRFGGQRPGRSYQDRSRSCWYRPASMAGRIFLALVALTVVGGFATSAYILKTWLCRDSRFRIAGSSSIDASGLNEVSRSQMLPVFGEDIGRNIFFVPLGERRKQLEEIPWVQSATVMRLLPDQIRVSVVERQPVAFVRQGQQIGLVDANGVLLTMPAAMMAQHHYSFPVVTGISASDPLGARKMRMAVYQRLLAELDSNGQRISEQISEINLADTEDVQVLMPEQGSDILVHFGEDRFLDRYQRYKAHIAEWRQQFPKLAGVDLRYDQKVVLDMATGADVAQATASDQAATGNDKPVDTQVGDGAQGENKPAAKHSAGVKAPPAHAQEVKSAKIGQKPGQSSKAKTSASAAAQKKAKALKAAAAKAKAAKEAKKHAQLKRAALTLNRQKTAPTASPVANAGQGQ